jgi:hypothetical protein
MQGCNQTQLKQPLTQCDSTTVILNTKQDWSPDQIEYHKKTTKCKDPEFQAMQMKKQVREQEEWRTCVCLVYLKFAMCCKWQLGMHATCLCRCANINKVNNLTNEPWCKGNLATKVQVAMWWNKRGERKKDNRSSSAKLKKWTWDCHHWARKGGTITTYAGFDDETYLLTWQKVGE